jgi:uncharacterized protein (TIGR02453 family)
MGEFTGLAAETLEFLAKLEANNTKEWFDEHRDDYQAHYLEPARELVTALGAELQALTPAIQSEPRVNGSIFRINRDVRFSKDKSPYKPHIDLWFWEGKGRSAGEASGYFFRLRAGSVHLGAGMHGFDKRRLGKYRAAVDADDPGARLAAIVARARADKLTVGGAHYKRVPKGHDPDHPRAELLRHNALFAAIEEPVPASIHSRRFVSWCMTRFKKAEPVHRWLVDEVL